MGKSFAPIAKWIAYIFGGIITAFFLFMIIAHLIDTAIKMDWVALKPKEITLFVFLGISLFGLILAYWKQLIGGIIAIIGSSAFILFESSGDSQIMPFSDGFFFYMLLSAGCFHINAWMMLRAAKTELDRT